MEGRLNLDEPVDYSIDGEDGHLNFSLTDATVRMLKNKFAVPPPGELLPSGTRNLRRLAVKEYPFPS